MFRWWHFPAAFAAETQSANSAEGSGEGEESFGRTLSHRGDNRALFYVFLGVLLGVGKEKAEWKICGQNNFREIFSRSDSF